MEDNDENSTDSVLYVVPKKIGCLKLIQMELLLVELCLFKADYLILKISMKKDELKDDTNIEVDLKKIKNIQIYPRDSTIPTDKDLMIVITVAWMDLIFFCFCV